MPYRLFTIPILTDGNEEASMNSFLASHRVLTVERQFVSNGQNSFWCFCVDFIASNSPGNPAVHGQGKKPRIDYREILTPTQFMEFVALRDLKQIIAKEESIPVYTIFTNEQLAAMVQANVRSPVDFRAVPGVGEGRMQKYGARFLDVLSGASNEASQPTV
jgi:superfamily II DNA helicase RecQ